MNTTLRRARVFVGTLCSGEGDFDSCCEIIAHQREVDITHVVISDLPERQAHNALWNAWNAAKANHDMFLKVDADTVLSTELIVAQIWKIMRDNPRVTGIQLPIHDYFTDGPIAGLNAFSPKVVFSETRDDLFCDRVDSGHDIVFKVPPSPSCDIAFHDVAKNMGINAYVSPVPVANHCHEANDAQAFHFGLHRALKRQTDVIARVHAAFKRDHDRLRGLALSGADAAVKFNDRHRDFNYTDTAFKAAFGAALVHADDVWRAGS